MSHRAIPAVSLIGAAALALAACDTAGPATPVQGATTMPSSQDIFSSGQNQTVIPPSQMEKLGPTAGPGQSVIFAPGGSITGAGLTGVPGGNMMLNGVSAGPVPR